jgi:hypothetical protein
VLRGATGRGKIWSYEFGKFECASVGRLRVSPNHRWKLSTRQAGVREQDGVFLQQQTVVFFYLLIPAIDLVPSCLLHNFSTPRPSRG